MEGRREGKGREGAGRRRGERAYGEEATLLQSILGRGGDRDMIRYCPPGHTRLPRGFSTVFFLSTVNKDQPP